jgi:hypothetical protein
LTPAFGAAQVRRQKGGAMRRTFVMASVVVVLTALFLLPGASEAEFKGTVVAGTDAILDVTPGVATGSAAVTVSYLNRKGSSVRDIDVATLTAGAAFAMTLPIRRNTSRIYIELDQSPNGVAQIRVTQGTAVITQDVVGDGRMVLDVAQGP